MKKITVIISISLIILGGIIFIVSFAASGFDINTLSTAGVAEKKEVLYENINDIEFDITTADLKIIKSSTDQYRLTYYETKNIKYNVLIDEDNNLMVEQLNKFNLLHINFIPIKDDIILEVPSSFIGELDVNSTTGKVEIDIDNIISNLNIELTTGSTIIKNVTSNNIKSSCTTGSTYIQRVTSKNMFEIKGTTGDVEIENIKANDVLISLSTGDIEFDGIDANKITLKATTGDVEGTLYNEMNAYTITSDTSTGDCNLPSYFDGEKYYLNVETSTGDIEIEFAKNK